MHFYGTTQFVAASSTLIDAMSVSMPPTAARKAAINKLIRSLQDAGIWDLLDVMWVLAAHSPQASLLNWKSPGTFTATAVNTPTWTADRGYTGNGSSSRINTTWTPSTNGVNFTANDASLWGWCLTNSQQDAPDIGARSDANVNRAEISFRTTGDRQNSYLNASNNSQPTVATGIGFGGAQRTSTTAVASFRDGVSINTGSIAVTARPTTELWICGASTGSFSSRQMAFGAAGASLAGRELAFYTAVLAYMQTVGAA